MVRLEIVFSTYNSGITQKHQISFLYVLYFIRYQILGYSKQYLGQERYLAWYILPAKSMIFKSKKNTINGQRSVKK